MNEGSVLVVSNETGLARSLGVTLAAKGYHVSHTGSFHEAISLVELGKHDVLILDNEASPIATEQACRKIRACSKIAIIVIASDDSGQKKTDAILAGADAYLPKPFGVAEILASIRDTLQKSRAKMDLHVLIS